MRATAICPSVSAWLTALVSLRKSGQNKINTQRSLQVLSLSMLYAYKYCVSGHYQSPSFYFKT